MEFNDNWIFYKARQEENKTLVNLPHDAMIFEKRDENNPGRTNISFFAGGTYIYEKDFPLTLSDPDSTIFFEFEGIYQTSTIIINGKEAYKEEYGYDDFIFDATKYCNLNGMNHIKVIADNSAQPNSRWYSGSGIYRPAHLFIKGSSYIVPKSIKIKTLDYKAGLIEVRASFNKPVASSLEIKDADDKLVHIENLPEASEIDVKLNIEDCKLWNTSTPYIYTCLISIDGDQEEVEFGVRQIELDNQKGLLINGERTILKGACIHHDNGLLGACSYDFAEHRKVKLLKEAGYNALRLAHNPSSHALLKAADHLGMLILDEYVDCWYIHKTKFDYAGKVENNYRKDLQDMVDKDYSHPSVIMYSTGNEVSETASKKGADFTKMLTDCLHSLDDSRPVTCGVNICFNGLCSIGFGLYSDKKADKNAKSKQRKGGVGSEFFNNLAGLLGAGFMKSVAKLHLCDITTKYSFANMDVAGYNYGIKRYKKDLRKYPNRFILGSETFCADASIFYNLAKDNPRIIGDFVWAGMDYLGESGIGSWINTSEIKDKDLKSNWLTAGSGRLDILGDESSEMAYTRTAFDEEIISMGVISPKDYRQGHSPSSWKMSWALDSYSFDGQENQKTEVEVYSQASRVDLYQNDKLVGTKKRNKNGFYSFKIKYIPGTLKALAISKDKKTLGSYTLTTASKETIMKAVPEDKSISLQDGLAYIHVYIQDKDGIIKPLEDTKVKIVKVDNGKILGFGNACAYNKEGYLTNEVSTYYGKAMLVAKPLAKGTLKVTLSSKYGESTAEVKVN